MASWFNSHHSPRWVRVMMTLSLLHRHPTLTTVGGVASSAAAAANGKYTLKQFVVHSHIIILVCSFHSKSTTGYNIMKNILNALPANMFIFRRRTHLIRPLAPNIDTSNKLSAGGGGGIIERGWRNTNIFIAGGEGVCGLWCGSYFCIIRIELARQPLKQKKKYATIITGEFLFPSSQMFQFPEWGLPTLVHHVDLCWYTAISRVTFHI